MTDFTDLARAINHGDSQNVLDVCRIYDVPPWVSVYGPPMPRFAWWRWKLRHVWPRLVWGR